MSISDLITATRVEECNYVSWSYDICRADNWPIIMKMKLCSTTRTIKRCFAYQQT